MLHVASDAACRCLPFRASEPLGSLTAATKRVAVDVRIGAPHCGCTLYLSQPRVRRVFVVWQVCVAPTYAVCPWQSSASRPMTRIGA